MIANDGIAEASSKLQICAPSTMVRRRRHKSENETVAASLSLQSYQAIFVLESNSVRRGIVPAEW